MHLLHDTEYVFWLDSWSDGSKILRTFGNFKCTVASNFLRLTSIEDVSREIFQASVFSISECRVECRRKSLVQDVVITINNQDLFFTPINPFDPENFLYTNHNEVSAMVQVINAVRTKSATRINDNPYIRQLKSNDYPEAIKNLDVPWNKNTSPWEYDRLYGDKFRLLKHFALIAVFIILGTAIILAIAFILDAFQII